MEFSSFYWRRIRHHSWLILGECHSSFYIELCCKLNIFLKIVLRVISIRIKMRDVRIERNMFFLNSNIYFWFSSFYIIVEILQYVKDDYHLQWNEDSLWDTPLGKNLETLRHIFFLRLIDQSVSITNFLSFAVYHVTSNDWSYSVIIDVTSPTSHWLQLRLLTSRQIKGPYRYPSESK